MCCYCVIVWLYDVTVSQLFLRSLPEDCFFNLVCFGDRFEKVWPESVKYSEDTLSKALEFIQRKHCASHIEYVVISPSPAYDTRCCSTGRQLRGH